MKERGDEVFPFIREVARTRKACTGDSLRIHVGCGRVQNRLAGHVCPDVASKSSDVTFLYEVKLYYDILLDSHLPELLRVVKMCFEYNKELAHFDNTMRACLDTRCYDV